MNGKMITVFGGSGFVGRAIVRELAKSGARVTVGCRDPEGAKFLKPMGMVGQVTPKKVDVTNAASIERAIVGADMVINLVGILYESGHNGFDAVQATAPGQIGKAAAAAGVSRVVHVSAIGADGQSASAYGRSKAAGEAAIRASFANVTIMRPSIVFGPDDGFFNKFGGMASFAPALPLIGGGGTKLQPVSVDDVAAAIMAALDDDGTAGKTYELGGPTVYSFTELMKLVLSEVQRDRMLIPVPFWVASLKAMFLELAPRPLLTRDQVNMLKSDNVVAEDALTLSDLGIKPLACEIVLPTYMDRFRPGGRYNKARAAMG